MIDMCPVDMCALWGRHFRQRSGAEAVRASGIWEMFSTLVLLDLKLEAGGKRQSSRLEFPWCPVAPLLSTSDVVGFLFQGSLWHE